MKKLLINYNFNNLEADSLEGGFTIKFQNANLIAGPGSTVLGQRTKAVNLGASGKANVDLTGLVVNSKKFCIQISFKVNAQVSNRQNILESNFLPFTIYADKGKTRSTFELISSVGLISHGWNKADTLSKKTLNINKWYTASLVYDLDTLGLFIDNQLVSVHGFPNGLIKTNATKKLFFGTWVDGVRNHFNGALAGFKWYDGIPSDLESLLDERRSSAEWHITYKHAQIKSKINCGKRVQDIKYDRLTGSHTQHYERCGIMYHESVGVAFEMHGAIYAKYKAMRNKSVLGYLVTDEVKATSASGRKSLFSKGGIYWSRATGAIPVLDQIYLEYENIGESKAFGFPTRLEANVSGGKQQLFQKCRMYYKNNTGRAQEVHGAILATYLRTGGVIKWGFPVTNETDVKKGRSIIGKSSEFEHCKIYWKSGVGAFEVHGSIRKKYEKLNGPIGKLGFPTSNEVDIPRHSGAGKMNSFQKGSILWYGSAASIKVARPFKIRLQRIATRESEGFGMGQNDIHFYITIKDGNRQIYHKRFPNNGDYGGHNVIGPKSNWTFGVEIMPNKVNQRISFSVDIRDSDPGNDDNLGRHTTVLNASNAWGYKQPNLDFNQSFGKTKTFLWSIRPKINIASLSVTQKWWKFDNFKTPTITKAQYAAAFRDVDSEPELWDIPDDLRLLFYNWVAKGIASGGNCVGMSLEAIYAMKNNSLLNEPLINVIENNSSKNEINIKHAYQVGARPIWWYLEQFVTGNTHDPKDVFLNTQNAHRRGDNPVVCISQNYDFSGAPHCVMPYAWDTSRKPWKMKIMDPNFPNTTRKVITVDPDRNTFQYISSSSRRYNGGAWSGGRFHYMPFCILDTRQRTPVWDAILLILAGTILILADDAETVSIQDANGKDLDGNGTRAKQVLKSGAKPEEFFASFVGYQRGVKKPGQMMMRREKRVSSSINAEVINLSSMPLVTLASNRSFRGFNTRSLPSNTNLKVSILNRSAHHILNDSAVVSNLTSELKDKLKKITQVNNKRNFQHKIKGVKNGKLEYLIRSGLTEVKIESTINKNEINTIKANDLGTNVSNIEFKSPKIKHLNLQITNKLGVNGDHMKISIVNIPIQANKSLTFNVKPGLAGVEIVNNGVRANLPIKFSGKVNGKNIAKNYTIPFEGAIRIKPSTMINTNDLLLSNISKLFGTVKKSFTIKKD